MSGWAGNWFCTNSKRHAACRDRWIGTLIIPLVPAFSDFFRFRTAISIFETDFFVDPKI